MQVFGVLSNFIDTDRPLESRIFTKNETSVWHGGEMRIPLLPDLAAEVELVGRLDAAVTGPVLERQARAVPVSYALGFDLGSTDCGLADGQWWRSKGALGYAPVGRFAQVDGIHAQSVEVNLGQESVSVPLSRMRSTMAAVVAAVSASCMLQSGDLFFLGAIHVIDDLSGGFDVAASAAGVPPVRLAGDSHGGMLELVFTAH